MLVDSGAITEEQLQEALAGQKATGKRLGTYLIDEGIINKICTKSLTCCFLAGKSFL